MFRGKRIVCMYVCVFARAFVCVCHLTQSGHLLITRSQVRNVHFLINALSHTNHRSQGAIYPTHTLTRSSTYTKSHPWSHFSYTHTHTLNQEWLNEQATQWEWVIRPLERRPDLSLHIKSSMRMCVFMSQWLWALGPAPLHIKCHWFKWDGQTWRGRGKRNGRRSLRRICMRNTGSVRTRAIFFTGRRERQSEIKSTLCQRSICCLGSLPLCMKNSQAEVFLNSWLVVGI